MLTKRPRIVIVGAGVAGLAAAHRLHTFASSSPFDLLVLEAGDRVGGRVLTSEFAGVRVEMGATWIHGIGGNPIHVIADQIGAMESDSRPWERMDGFPSGPVTVAEGGVLVDDEAVVGPVTELYRKLMDAARDGEAVVEKASPGVGPYLRRGLREYQAGRKLNVIGSSNTSNHDDNAEVLEEAVFRVNENTDSNNNTSNHNDIAEVLEEAVFRVNGNTDSNNNTSNHNGTVEMFEEAVFRVKDTDNNSTSNHNGTNFKEAVFHVNENTDSHNNTSNHNGTTKAFKEAVFHVNENTDNNNNNTSNHNDTTEPGRELSNNRNNIKWSSEALEEAVFRLHENTEREYTSADDLADLDLAAEGEYKDYPGDEVTIPKGYSTVVHHLAAALPTGIVALGKRVRRIEWLPTASSSATPVKLHLDGSEAVTADHIIVTVSLGVLKAGKGGGLEFSPPLPAPKREAIGRLGFGLVNKLFIELEPEPEAEVEEFPFLQMAFSEMPPPGPPAVPRWMRRTASLCPVHGGSRLVLAWLAGEEAVELERMEDGDVAAGVDATLAAFWPAGRRRVVGVKRSGWGRDPLFLGSYSYVKVGSSGDDVDVVAGPLPSCDDVAGDVEGGRGPPQLQVLFAGEATHRTSYSTTHGAYLSGIREASRLICHYNLS